MVKRHKDTIFTIHPYADATEYVKKYFSRPRTHVRAIGLLKITDKDHPTGDGSIPEDTR